VAPLEVILPIPGKILNSGVSSCVSVLDFSSCSDLFPRILKQDLNNQLLIAFEMSYLAAVFLLDDFCGAGLPLNVSFLLMTFLYSFFSAMMMGCQAEIF
jgi:hypothetical protein